MNQIPTLRIHWEAILKFWFTLSKVSKDVGESNNDFSLFLFTRTLFVWMYLPNLKPIACKII